MNSLCSNSILSFTLLAVERLIQQAVCPRQVLFIILTILQIRTSSNLQIDTLANSLIVKLLNCLNVKSCNWYIGSFINYYIRTLYKLLIFQLLNSLSNGFIDTLVHCLIIFSFCLNTKRNKKSRLLFLLFEFLRFFQRTHPDHFVLWMLIRFLILNSTQIKSMSKTSIIYDFNYPSN